MNYNKILNILYLSHLRAKPAASNVNQFVDTKLARKIPYMYLKHMQLLSIVSKNQKGKILSIYIYIYM